MENEEYYAVFQGKQTGVFRSWTEVQPLVSGFSGAVFKKFATLAEAELYAKTGETKVEKPLPVECRNSHFIYTDGAFSSKTKRCGVGVAFDAPYQACAIAKTLPTGSTHQQAEIEAIVCALLAVSQNGELKRLAHVTIWTDSDYALKCLTVWCPRLAKKWMADNTFGTSKISQPHRKRHQIVASAAKRKIASHF